MSQTTCESSQSPINQLRKENKFLGNIITALKSNKSELEGTNTALQRHIHQISHQFTETTSENEALRNIAVGLRRELDSVHRGKRKSTPSLVPNKLKKSTKISSQSANILPTATTATNPKLISVQSIHRSKRSRINTEDEIHCLKQEMHDLEMQKLDLLKYHQQCVMQLHEMVDAQQTLQQKLSHIENENLRLRQRSLDENASSIRGADERDSREDRENRVQLTNLKELSFDTIIEEIGRLEEENLSHKDLKSQLHALYDENQRLKERLQEKQNENQSLFEKYSVTLQQYQILIKHYLK